MILIADYLAKLFFKSEVSYFEYDKRREKNEADDDAGVNGNGRFLV